MKWLDLVRREPVRVYMYTLLTAIIGLLLYFGVVTAAAAPIIMAVVTAALAMPSPVETVRNMVSPVSTKPTEEENR